MKKPALSLLFSATAFLLSAQTVSKHETQGPIITFASLEHDYGTIPNGANGACEFHFTNTGDAPLIISSCHTSCGCMVCRYDITPVMPGKSGVIQVKYDTKRAGPITKTATVTCNATNMPTVHLRIKGTVEMPLGELAPPEKFYAPAGTDAPVKGPRIAFASKVHDYGTLAYGSDGVCTFTYTNTGDEPLVIRNCKSSCGCVVPKCEREPLAPGKSAVVHVKYDTHRRGPINKSVTVESNAINDPIVVLQIKGEVLPDTAQAPPSLIKQ